MEHPDCDATEGARAAIAFLQQSVQGWIDADLILPADGSSLQTALERARAGLAGKKPAAARAGVAAFIGRVEALIEAGALEIVDGREPLATARALGKEIDHVCTIRGPHPKQRCNED